MQSKPKYHVTFLRFPFSPLIAEEREGGRGGRRDGGRGARKKGEREREGGRERETKQRDISSLPCELPSHALPWQLPGGSAHCIWRPNTHTH